MKTAKYLTSEIFKQNSAYYMHRDILPNPDKILARNGGGSGIYGELKNDPHVWSCIQSRKSGLLSLDFNIVPNGVSSGVQKEIEKIIAGLDIRGLLSDLLEAPLFGWQPLEVIWKHCDNGRMIFPDRIVPKPREWFYFNSEGKLYMRQPGSIDGKAVPEMKLLLPRHAESSENPYGSALLAKCYWPVTFKKGAMRFWVNFAERYGMPLLIGQYTRGATTAEAEKLAGELASMTEDAVIVTPSDIDIRMQEAARTGSAELFRELIKICNAEISKALLSQTLTTELDRGSYAASETHFRIRREVILADLRLAESVINELIGWICRLNFRSAGQPLFRGVVNDSDNNARAERDLKLCQTGQVIFTKKYWMDTYGFREEDLE